MYAFSAVNKYRFNFPRLTSDCTFITSSTSEHTSNEKLNYFNNLQERINSNISNIMNYSTLTELLNDLKEKYHDASRFSATKQNTVIATKTFFKCVSLTITTNT